MNNTKPRNEIVDDPYVPQSVLEESVQMENERISRYSFMPIFILIKSNRCNSDMTIVSCVKSLELQVLDRVDDANEIEVRRSHIVKDAIKESKKMKFSPKKVLKV